VVPPHVLALRELGVANVGLYDLTLNSKELSDLHLIIAENATCLPPETVQMLVKWMRKGGTFLATSDFATYDEIGRRRVASKLIESLRVDELKTMRVGKGQLIVASRGELSGIIVGRTDEVFKIEGLDAGQVEVQPYASRSRRRVVLHVINHGAKMTKNWRLNLPAGLAATSRNLIMRTPKSDAPTPLRLDGQTINVPPMDAYAVIELEVAR